MGIKQTDLESLRIDAENGRLFYLAKSYWIKKSGLQQGLKRLFPREDFTLQFRKFPALRKSGKLTTKIGLYIYEIRDGKVDWIDSLDEIEIFLVKDGAPQPWDQIKLKMQELIEVNHEHWVGLTSPENQRAPGFCILGLIIITILIAWLVWTVTINSMGSNFGFQ